jgi:hypothetical protein
LHCEGTACFALSPSEKQRKSRGDSNRRDSGRGGQGGRGRGKKDKQRKFDNLLSIMPTHDVSAVHSTVPMSLQINHHPPLTVHSLVDTGAL